MRPILLWLLVGGLSVAAIAVAATSPLIEWRGPVYVVAGLAGVIGLVLIAVQPLLAAGYLAGLPAKPGRRVHRWTGAALVLAVLVHVIGLWITSPPDVIDALLFTSATPFSAWGVIAMWAIFAAALLGATRRKLPIGLRIWRFAHTALATLVVGTTVAHAMLIQGTMGTVTKAALCALALGATAKALADLRSWAFLTQRRR